MDSKRGAVLGIFFDTDTLTWSISDEKAGRILRRIQGPLLGDPVSLLETQQLLGSLNDVGQMCPFLRGFRHPLQTFLTEFGEDAESFLTRHEKTYGSGPLPSATQSKGYRSHTDLHVPPFTPLFSPQTQPALSFPDKATDSSRTVRMNSGERPHSVPCPATRSGSVPGLHGQNTSFSMLVTVGTMHTAASHRHLKPSASSSRSYAVLPY